MGKITFSGKDFTPGGQWQLLWSFIPVAICYCKEHVEVTKRLYKQLLQTIHLLVPGWPVPTFVKPTPASSSILSSSSGHCQCPHLAMNKDFAQPERSRRRAFHSMNYQICCSQGFQLCHIKHRYKSKATVKFVTLGQHSPSPPLLLWMPARYQTSQFDTPPPSVNKPLFILTPSDGTRKLRYHKRSRRWSFQSVN